MPALVHGYIIPRRNSWEGRGSDIPIRVPEPRRGVGDRCTLNRKKVASSVGGDSRQMPLIASPGANIGTVITADAPEQGVPRYFKACPVAQRIGLPRARRLCRIHGTTRACSRNVTLQLTPQGCPGQPSITIDSLEVLFLYVVGRLCHVNTTIGGARKVP